MKNNKKKQQHYDKDKRQQHSMTVTLRTQTCSCVEGGVCVLASVWDHVIGHAFKEEERNYVTQNQSRKQTGNSTTTLPNSTPGQEAQSPNVLI